MNPSGATAGSKEFSTREQAIENQYARQKEQEQLKALKEKLNATEAANKKDNKGN